MDFLDEEFNKILDIFQMESDEIVSRLNNNLLILEKRPNDKDAILALFRDAHSLKGASRMIGFNNIQTISHKIEDILGLAKEGKLFLNPKMVDVLYKTVDFVAELIQTSVESKREIYSDRIQEQIQALENIGELTEESSSQVEKSELNVDFLFKNIKEINAVISDVLFLLMKMEIEKNESVIKSLISCTKRLHSIFGGVGLYEIKRMLDDVIFKLDFVNKVSSTLTITEIEDIGQIFNSVISTLTSTCEIYKIEIVDFYSLAFDKLKKDGVQKPENTAVQESQEVPQLQDETLIKDEWEKLVTKKAEDEILSKVRSIEKESETIQENLTVFDQTIGENEPQTIDFNNLCKKISGLSQNASSIAEIKANLQQMPIYLENPDIKNIFEKITKILDFSNQSQILPDEDTVSVLKQALEQCECIVKNKGENIDSSLILQRLEIVSQLMDLKTNEAGGIATLPQKEFTLKSKKIVDFSKIFDTGEIKTLRVDSEKLDSLVNQVGELLITKIKTKKHLKELHSIEKDLQEWQRNSSKLFNQLKYYDKKYFANQDKSENPMSFFIKQLLAIFEENTQKISKTISEVSGLHRTIHDDGMKMNLIVDDLEHMIKNIRVLPLATIFHLFGRMVRDIAKEKNKKIELEILGSETSADKKIIEEIKTPLIHIIRNAIDHGIETPEERTALGKNPVGKILLKANILDNNILIEIIDDGRGVNIEKIKNKALQKGFLTQEEIESMSDEEITNLIFVPGFSTGDEITSISGRGIGLDVVQTKISQLNGKVRIISEVNKGCCVQIELPTTMSTLKSFLVKSSNQTFAIPMASISTVVWKKQEEIFSGKDARTITHGEKTIPIYNLSDILNLPKETLEHAKETILIIESDNKILGLEVDSLLGDQDVLHKKLSAPIYRLKNISGVTTLASGEVCLILNISDIFKTVYSQNFSKLQAPVQEKFLSRPKADYKILLVDDSITTRTLEKNILTKAGYDIEIATNPKEAFEKIDDCRYDLIISDVEMPEMDGFSFLKQLKSDEMYFDIPVIMVSSLHTEENKNTAKELGAAHYIVKQEFNQDEFLQVIANIFSKQVKKEG